MRLSIPSGPSTFCTRSSKAPSSSAQPVACYTADDTPDKKDANATRHDGDNHAKEHGSNPDKDSSHPKDTNGETTKKDTDGDGNSDKDSVERKDADPKAEDYSANGKADDADAHKTTEDAPRPRPTTPILSPLLQTDMVRAMATVMGSAPSPRRKLKRSRKLLGAERARKSSTRGWTHASSRIRI